jgi:pyocin large subunit-like protein
MVRYVSAESSVLLVFTQSVSQLSRRTEKNQATAQRDLTTTVTIKKDLRSVSSFLEILKKVRRDLAQGI